MFAEKIGSRKAIKAALIVVCLWTLAILWKPCMKMVIKKSFTALVNPNIMLYVGCDVSLDDYSKTVGYKLTEVPNCINPVCSLNNGRTPVTRQLPNVTCSELRECVTALVKTKHRLQNVENFILSLHKFYPGVPIIIADEIDSQFNPQDIPEKWMALNSSDVIYFQVHAGVGFGRQVAAQMAQSPYILVADDDFVVTEKTDLMKLVSVLSTTDTNIVGGVVNDKFPYDGAIRVVEDRSTLYRPHLAVYPGIFYEVVPCHRSCFMCDIIKNFFLADREAILKAGGWDISRLYYEHEDFFLQMRKQHLKVAHCSDVVIDHNTKDRTLAKQRTSYFQTWSKLLKIKWGFDDYYYCNPSDYYHLHDCDKTKNFS